MGNALVNVNITSQDHNITYNGTSDSTPYIPPFRAAQKISEIQAELASFATMAIVAIAFNITTVILLQKKFKTVPHILLQNIMVVDMLTPILNGPFLSLGLMVHTLGEYTPTGCNIQGYFHATLSTVFINSVSLIAVSRCLASLRPWTYHRIFVNKVNVRILLIALWSSSALICVPPMNGWGRYRRYEGTCWLAWLPGERSHLAYNVIVTSLPLSVEIISCLVGLKVVLKANKVGDVVNNDQKSPEENGQVPEASPIATRINTDVFFVAFIQLLVYIALWGYP